MWLAEDHGLANGDAAIEVAEGLILLLPVPADKVVLPNVGQSELLLSQLDDDGPGDNLHGKFPEIFLEGGGGKQHLAVPGESPGAGEELVRPRSSLALRAKKMGKTWEWKEEKGRTRNKHGTVKKGTRKKEGMDKAWAKQCAKGLPAGNSTNCLFLSVRSRLSLASSVPKRSSIAGSNF